MADQWYVQAGGKEVGPLSPSQLKSLAGQGKITPATQVRRGSDAAWVAASRVKGLFEAPPAAALKSQATPAATPPKVSAPPAPPPIAPARPAATRSLVPKAVPVEGRAPMTAQILGAAGLILGTLALATFWLPVLGAVGWTGIAVGGVGLLLAIAGLVVSARKGGAGLYLNVAGASSSLVGLVLTVVLGAVFGMFGSQPPPLAAPIAATLVAPPPAAPPAAEPEPPPEIVWTPHDQPIEQPPIRATLTSAKVETVRFERDLLSGKAPKPEPRLKIRISLENTSTNRIVNCPGWSGGAGLVSADLEKAVAGALGESTSSVTASATLVDDVGNQYKQTPALMLFGDKSLMKDPALRPGEKRDLEVVFATPLETIDYVRLELSANGFEGTEPLRFQIPQAGIERPQSK
ncbi:MAG TPA: DUF4339 domain-containing protein [Pirellulales bacterium]|jgi:hypothetical protein|nr:DUF4339 domain-containing protein [Pirellulales bacterium]